MQALCPGAKKRLQRHALTGRPDFTGPACIGLAAMFSPAATQGGDEEDGEAEKLSSSGGAAVGVSPAAPAAAADAARALLASATSADYAELGPRWQQRAVALTHCHLWRVDCRKLYHSLRRQQPAMMLHLVRRLLGNLGLTSDAIAASMASSPAAQRVEAQQAQRQAQAQAHSGSHTRQALVQRLLSMQAELEALVAARAKNGGADAHVAPSHEPSRLGRGSAATWLSSEASWREADGAELEAVGVEGGGGDGDDLTADVWHATPRP